MTTAIKVVCFLLVLLGVLPWLLAAGFSPMLFDAGNQMTKLAILRGSVVLGIIWGVPLWVLFFAWTTIKTWHERTLTPALLMTLPALLFIGLIVYANVAGR